MLPLELWREIVSILIDEALKQPITVDRRALPDSVSPRPLDQDYGYPGQDAEPPFRWQLRWQTGAPVLHCTPRNNCHSPLGMLSDQTQFCFRRRQALPPSDICSVLWICKNLKAKLEGFGDFWRPFIMSFPSEWPASFDWIATPDHAPLRLVADQGYCRCVTGLIKAWIQFARDISLTLPATHSSLLR